MHYSELQSSEIDVDRRMRSVEVNEMRKRRHQDKFRAPSRTECRLGQMRMQQSKQARVQSEEMSSTDDTTTEKVVAENLVFRDEALSQRITMGDMNSGNYDADADSTADLGGFLSRPVRIATINWAESTFTNTTINPWYLYFNTAQIKKKLDNYGKISCRLHLKFVVNASPFYYGSIRACYFPLGDERADFNNTIDQVPFSQVPGVYIEPQNMSTAEMVLPFLWHRNWFEATAAFDFSAVGALQFLQYANLRSANGVSGTGITIAVYAWAEDVRVMGPTTILALQSDEYEDTTGTVSGPATTVADLANKLSDAPLIGDFAKATEIGARAVAGIAKMFGYSNPPMIDDVPAMQNKVFHAFANVETRMPIDKLAIDPKNEVTISSKVAGVDEEDPLAFTNLLTRESFLLGTLWSNSQAVDTLLWSALVGPGYRLSGGGYFTTPPVSHFSQMFRFWRGSLVYKFRFIKTKYHKGRVIISYDPNGDITGTSDTETTTFTRIVDLAVEDEVEVVVPYKATSPWLVCSQNTGLISNGTSPGYTYNSENYNGSISMRVQNILTGPAANPQIDVLTYVRAGEDFMFSVPTEISTTITTRDPAGVIQSEEQDDTITVQSISPDQHVATITTGELITSLRPVLHRASLGYQQFAGGTPMGKTAGLQTTSNYIWRIPRGVGRSAQGYSTATVGGVGVRYNFCPNHPIDWTLECFVGVRGSTNIHVNATAGGSNVERVTHLSVHRHFSTPLVSTSSAVANTEYWLGINDAPNNLSRQAIRYPSGDRTVFPTGQTAVSVTNCQAQPGLSVNLPQYSRFRFLPAFHTTRSTDPKNEQFFYDEAAVTCQFHSANTITSTTDWPVLSYYYGAGVDFQPVFFLCTPRIFTTSLPPARETFP